MGRADRTPTLSFEIALTICFFVFGTIIFLAGLCVEFCRRTESERTGRWVKAYRRLRKRDIDIVVTLFNVCANVLFLSQLYIRKQLTFFWVSATFFAVARVVGLFTAGIYLCCKNRARLTGWHIAPHVFRFLLAAISPKFLRIFSWQEADIANRKSKLKMGLYANNYLEDIGWYRFLRSLNDDLGLGGMKLVYKIFKSGETSAVFLSIFTSIAQFIFELSDLAYGVSDADNELELLREVRASFQEKFPPLRGAAMPLHDDFETKLDQGILKPLDDIIKEMQNIMA